MNLENIINQYPNAGIFVRDKHGREIFAHNASQLFQPASGMKLITTACLLDAFELNHSFDTELRCTGELSDDGILHGDLLIKGNWDPSLGSTRFENGIANLFEELLQAVYAFGIQKIDGAVLCERGQDVKTSVNKNWSKEDIPNYYAAGAAQLSFNENSFAVNFSTTHQGSFAKIEKIFPNIPNLKIENDVRAGEPNGGDNAWFKNSARGLKYQVSGTIPAYSQNFPVKAAVFRPGKILAQLFYNFLKENHVIIPPIKEKENQRVGIIDEFSELIYTHRSAKIDSLLKVMNEHSINLYAENLARATIKEENNLIFKKSIFFQNCFGHINLENSNSALDDFCGLSPKNRISPIFMVDFLQAVASSKMGDRFLDTLHDYEQSGIKAKTGTMSGVKTFSGLSIKDGLFFSIMINDIKPITTTKLLASLEF
jgi:D-alanyl-D-alanine carboxypeptidase/D-alanyl-D-alanine-endopeptidase (penicillin-binding protein 4)